MLRKPWRSKKNGSSRMPANSFTPPPETALGLDPNFVVRPPGEGDDDVAVSPKLHGLHAVPRLAEAHRVADVGDSVTVVVDVEPVSEPLVRAHARDTTPEVHGRAARGQTVHVDDEHGPSGFVGDSNA